MRQIIKLAGVDLPNATQLPVVQRTPEGIAMGAVPGWNTLLDPDYEAGGGLRNRARPNAAMPPASGSWDSSNFGEFPNGARAVDLTSNSANRLPNTVAANPNAWSVVLPMSIDMTTPASAPTEIIRPEDTSGPGIAIRITIRTGGEFAVFGAAAITTRITDDEPSFPDDTPTLIMVTFSTRDGLRVFRDGALWMSNLDDKQPLDDQFGIGEFAFLRAKAASGVDAALFGMVGLLDIDLGQAENAPYRRQIELFMREKYGITAIPA